MNNEEQVLAIFKNAPDAVIVIDNIGYIKKWNPAAEKMFGWMMDEVIGKLLQDIFVAELSQGIAENYIETFLAEPGVPGQITTISQKVLRKTNDIIDVELTASPFKVNDNYWFIMFLRDVTIRKKAEEALKESEERYRLLTNEVHGHAVFMLSPEGYIKTWNKGGQRIKGYGEREILGKHFSVFYPIEDIENNIPGKQLDIVTKEGWLESEGWRVKKDGTLFWANIVMTALSKSGKIIGFSKITKDITNQKKAEEASKLLNNSLKLRVAQRTHELRLSEQNYHKVFESAPVPMYVLSLPALRFLDVNEAAIINYGYSRQEFLTMSAYDILADDEKERLIRLYHSPCNGIKNMGCWRYMKKDRSVIYAETSTQQVTIGTKMACLVLSVNVTERKKAEERLACALEAGQIGIWELDLVNDSSVRNLRHDHIFGYQEEIPCWGARDLLSHIHPGDQGRVEESFKTALNIKCWSVETKIVWPDQTIHWVMITGKVIGNNKEKDLYMLGTVIDITNLKKSEEDIGLLNNELEQRVEKRTDELCAANKELESFSYSVSHDLRAPLRAMHSYSAMLLENGAKFDDDVNRVLGRIMFNAKKMERLIYDLLDFSRLSKATLKKATLNLNKIVSSVISDLVVSNKYHNNIVMGDLGMAIADRVTIRLVFQNLLLNATKYSSKKEKPLVEVGLTNTGNSAIYFVKDNGVGFDMKYYDKMFGIFQRFHSNEDFEGTGVGLAIVQRIISKHGGKVWAESGLNEGTTFYFTLQ